MTIYTFNLLVGYEPNGVDVAQVTGASTICLYDLAQSSEVSLLSFAWPQG